MSAPHPLQPGPRPAWVRALCDSCDPRWISLDADALLAEAQRNTGLSDFGGDGFQQGLRVFLRAVEDEAQLHFVGRALTRGDVLNLLENRLRMADWRKRHPEIDAVRIEKPLFIMGLPRTGTSILHELLAQDPAHRVPLHWEVRYPCPPPESASFDTDPRILRAHREIRLWTDIVPEYDRMHELGGALPVECIFLTQHEFLSEQLAGTHQVPCYAAWLAEADQRPAYAFHKRMLQLLSWRCARERWVLKAPSHLTALRRADLRLPRRAHRLDAPRSAPGDGLGREHPVRHGVGALGRRRRRPRALLVRRRHLRGAARRGDTAARQRRRARAAVRRLLYGDLVRDPIGALRGLYLRFELPFTREAEARMRAYLAAKPKDKHGAHRYSFEATGADRAGERQRFAEYQRRFGVPSEL